MPTQVSSCLHACVCSSCQHWWLGKTRSAAVQGTREVEGLVFSMVSDIGKLKRKVDLLGSPKDTLSHRCAGKLAGGWTPCNPAHRRGDSMQSWAVTACLRHDHSKQHMPSTL